MTIVVTGSFATGFRVPVIVKNVRRSENLLDAAEVAEKCGDIATRDELLEKAVALASGSPTRRQSAAA